MQNLFKKGQGMVEYAFIIILVAVVIVVVIATMGPGVGNMYQSVIDSYNSAVHGP